MRYTFRIRLLLLAFAYLLDSLLNYGAFAYVSGPATICAKAFGINCPAIPAVTMTLSGSSAFETTVDKYSGVTSIGELTRAAGTTTTPFTSITTQDSSSLIVMENASLGSDVLPTAGRAGGPAQCDRVNAYYLRSLRPARFRLQSVLPGLQLSLGVASRWRRG